MLVDRKRGSRLVLMFILALAILVVITTVYAIIAEPGGEVELRVQQCDAEDKSSTANNYVAACGGTYPGACGSGSNDRLSCNDGNVETNISANFSDLWTNNANPTDEYQFKVRNVTSGCFVFENTTTTYTDAFDPPTSSSIIHRLNFTSGYQSQCNNASIDISITVPPDEPGGDKNSTIIFTGIFGEEY